MNKKLNLAFCLFKYFPFGGLQGDFLQISKICLDRGHKVDAYTITWEGEKPDGLNVTLVPVTGLSNHGQYKSFGNKIAQLVKLKNYDAVVGFNRIPGLDIYYTADGSYAAKMQERSPLHRISNRYRTFMSLEKAVFSKDSNTEILLLTDKEKKFYMDYYGTAKERFHILPPGISKKCIPSSNADEIRSEKRKDLKIDEKKNIILMVCTVFKIKGVERAIKALASLPPNLFSETVLAVVGSDKPGKYKRLAKKLNISKQVKFLGARTDVPHLLMASDLFLHPALIENTGTVIVEALVANIPVITTDICGYSHHVTSADAGRVIPSPFIQETLNKELEYILTSKKHNQWQNNAKKYIEKTDVFSRSEKAVDVIEKVTGMINLPDDWKKYWKIKEKGLKKLFNVQGKVFREKDGRRTLCFKYDKKRFFGKFHSGVGWKKILKNLLQLRKPPVLSAQNEWQAILKLKQLNIDTMNLVGYGKTGWNPSSIKSFVITEELLNIISLEDYCRDWDTKSPDKAIKESIITKVAQIARTIHENGMNHKDLYICHFLLDISDGIENVDPENITLFLIDLHRVEIRSKIPFYWRAKDVSAILFSSLDIGLTKQDVSLFMQTYHNTTTKKSLTKHRFFWWIVKKRAFHLYKREFKKNPTDIL